MLGVDEAHQTPSHKELVKGYVIESLIQYYPRTTRGEDRGIRTETTQEQESKNQENGEEVIGESGWCGHRDLNAHGSDGFVCAHQETALTELPGSRKC
jgi:hypothetical protein